MWRIALIAVLFVAACAPEFSPSSFVDKPRILGIVANPPEVPFTQENPGSVTLHVVVAMPGPDETGNLQQTALKDLEWAVCPMSLGAEATFACAVPEIPVLDTDFEARTATFDGQVLSTMIDFLADSAAEYMEFIRGTIEQDDECNNSALAAWDKCSQYEAAQLKTCQDDAFAMFKVCLLEKGLELMFHVTITVEIDGQELKREGYKRVAFRAPKEGRVPNKNPGFEVLYDGQTVASTEAVSNTLAVCPGKRIKLEPRLFDDAIEFNPDAGGDDEFVFFSWVVTSGRFRSIKTSMASIGEDGALEISNEWTAWELEAMPKQTTMWVFARDDRLGVAFVTFPVVPLIDPVCDVAGPNYAVVRDAGELP
jgi:hypothetical protein